MCTERSSQSAIKVRIEVLCHKCHSCFMWAMDHVSRHLTQDFMLDSFLHLHSQTEVFKDVM